MKYPTLKSLHKKLICESIFNDFAHTIAKLPLEDALGYLDTIERVIYFPGMIKEIEKILTKLHKAGIYTANDISKELERLMTVHDIDIAMFYLQGEIDETKGFRGAVNTMKEILDSIPEEKLTKFMRALRELDDSEMFNIARAYYNASPGAEEEAIKRTFASELDTDARIGTEDFAKNFRSTYDAFNDGGVKLAADKNEAKVWLNKLFDLITAKPSYDLLEKMSTAGSSLYVQKILSKALRFPAEREKAFEAFVATGLFAEDSYYIISQMMRIYTDLTDLALDYDRESDKTYKNFLTGLKSLVGRLRGIKPDDCEKAFKSINEISDDRKFSLVREIYIAVMNYKDNPADYFANLSPERERANYKNFKKLHSDIQDNYISLMRQLAKEWTTAHGEDNEARRKKFPPEADSDDPAAIFDDYAFADERKELPYEPNNEEENKIYKTLKAHFKFNIPIPPDVADKFRDIIAKGYYDTIFRPPGPGKVFRGMKVTKEWLEKPLGTGAFPVFGDKEAKFNYTPRENQGISSWTLSLEKAIDFARSPRPDEYSIVLVADAEDNPLDFVSCPGGLYKVPGFDVYDDEEEVIGTSKIKCSHVFWNKGKSLRQEDLEQYNDAEDRRDADNDELED